MPLPSPVGPAQAAHRTAPPAVIELRQYTLRPGRRDELIELFDRELVEPQEEAGMAVLGQFRDLDDPDRFVWLRGFPDMTARHHALTDFYGGPAWSEHGPRANATMLDSDDVLLLRPEPALRSEPAGSGFSAPSSGRPPVGTPPPDRFVAATVWFFPPGHEGVTLIRDGLLPVLRETGPAPFALLATEHARNTFPRLPVRAGENVVTIFTSYADEDAHRRHLAEVAAHPLARAEVLPGIERAQTAEAQRLRLRPTGRSLS
ncbi:NIPSNAP family protein [Streptomyces huasconensis]|uniref:NIPSNAP family protein n=1 Tax=Streptomyces huasconensis TaxID=1854574 RepID=UPI0037029653